MPYDNTFHLIGYLGQDPKIGFFQDGTAHTKLSCQDKRKDKHGNTVEHTEWFNVKLVGQPAQFAAQYLKQGDCVEIWGSIWSYEYVSKQTGEVKRPYEVKGKSIKTIESKNKAKKDETSPTSMQPENQPPADDDIDETMHQYL